MEIPMRPNVRRLQPMLCLSVIIWLIAVTTVGAAEQSCGDQDFAALQTQLSLSSPIDARSVTAFLPGGSDGEAVLRYKYDDKTRFRLFETNGLDEHFRGREVTIVSVKQAPDKPIGEFSKENSTLIQFIVPEHHFPLWRNRTFVAVACPSDGNLKWGVVRARVSSIPAVAVICVAILVLLYLFVTLAVTAIHNRAHPLGAKYPSYQNARRLSFSQMLDPVRLTADVFNHASVQKLQILMFSLLVAGMLLALVLTVGLLSDLSTTVLGLLGISGVGAAVAQTATTTRSRLSFENWAWLVRRDILPINQSESDGPRWGDIVLTNREFDIYKLQTIVFSLAVAAALIVAGAERLASFTVPGALLGILGLSQVVYIGGIFARPRSIADLDDAVTELRKRDEIMRAAVAYDTDTDAEGKLPKLPDRPAVPRPSLVTTKATTAVQRYRSQAQQVAFMIESTLEVDVDESKFAPQLD